MKIKDNSNPKTVRVADIEPGDTFKLMSSYYMKLSPLFNNGLNVVDITTGRICAMVEDTEVLPLNGYFVVED